MKFIRRHDLTPHTRIEMVRLAWLHQGIYTYCMSRRNLRGAYAYGHDNGKIWPPRCAVIVAARGDRCHPLPACSTPPAGAGSVRSALAAGSGLVSTADPGGSL